MKTSSFFLDGLRLKNMKIVAKAPNGVVVTESEPSTKCYITFTNSDFYETAGLSFFSSTHAFMPDNNDASSRSSGLDGLTCSFCSIALEIAPVNIMDPKEVAMGSCEIHPLQLTVFTDGGRGFPQMWTTLLERFRHPYSVLLNF
ncbi:hypothetical protein PsorP6_014615 [Peronosclerospora sorghi]|uniref:Uncharacterized protein n=1 Tax=Peronosclerospora sorghi TaxID=230839 RepID=A0ACC0VS80_9STRA|nr:hypothetical protein PsorP6_014615 [Peronosclerospora sorghi]